jgi:pyruvate/2-oxoglutarate dehydrogenase complex dihydrolipoamide acyltransferase (E2) component
MTRVPIIMPQLGESIAEATIVSFLVNPGDSVEADQDIIEVETNKANMNVVSPARGRVGQFTAQSGESYPVGATLGQIEVTPEEAARLGLDTVTVSKAVSVSTTPAAGGSGLTAGETRVQPTIRGLPVPANVAGAGYMSPRLKARMNELGLHAADLAGLAGSGSGGRVTVEDFERYISNLEKQKLTPASSMRVAVADAMRRSWTRPLATVGMPVLMDRLLAHRRAQAVKPGPALYGLRALAIALSENSAPAGRLIGNKIVHPSAIDLGFGVEVEDGVLVPVLRKADQTTLADLVPRYNRLIELARQRKLPADATGGSIATVTNYGTFGLTLATPIPLPEQNLVLGMGAGRKVVRWDEANGKVVPVTEMHLTLSFDHRVLDGGAAGRLLGRVVDLLMHPDRL